MIWRALFLGLFMLAVPARAGTGTEALAQPHAVEVFAKLPFMERPRLSPDGSSVAALMSIHGEQRFAIVDIHGARAPVVFPIGEGTDLRSWHWVNAEWLVLALGKDEKYRGDSFAVTRAMRLSRDGKTAAWLAKGFYGQNSARLIWTADDGSARVLLTAQGSIFDELEFWPTVIEADLATGHEHIVEKPHPDVIDWYADNAGNLRMGVGYDDRHDVSRLLYRHPGDMFLKTIERARRKDDEHLTVPVEILPDSNQALVLDDSGEFTHLRRYDLGTQTLGADLFGIDGYDVDGVVESRADGHLLGATYTTDARHVHWFDEALAQVQADLDKAVPGRSAEILQLSRDRKHMLVHVGAPDRMGAYYIFSQDRGTLGLLGYENAELKMQPMAPVRTIHYSARDGLRISAILTLPKGRQANGLPLILMPHGGPNARDYEAWDYWAQFFADRGYAVIQPNYRGSTGFGTAFEKAGEDQWGLKMQDDLDDAVDYLAAQGIANPKRVCIVGGSYGGYAAMYAASRDGERFRCAVSFAGVSDLVALKRYDRTFLDKDARTDWLEARVANLEAVSPVNNIANVSIPILLVHGKEDRRVPVAQSRDYARDLEKAGKNVRYVELPHGDHHLSREADRLTFLKESETFVAKYNPAY